MLQTVKKGFTLIELLVVITIIGILATGATTVYTSQIQKARDTTRVSDMKALQGAVEQAYQDDGQYPWLGTNFDADVDAYMPRLPSDPRSGIAGVSAFDYLYNGSQDTNNIPFQEYELSTTFEQSGNLTTKAADTADSGNDNNRLEIGINLGDTQHATTVNNAIGTYTAANRCVAVGWWNATADGTCAAAVPTIIRTN